MEAVHELGALKTRAQVGVDTHADLAAAGREVGRKAEAIQEAMEAAFPERFDQAAFLAGCLGLYLVIGGPGVPRTLAEALIALRPAEPGAEEDPCPR